MIFTAASEKFLDIEEVLKRPASDFLMYVNYYMRKQELEAERIEKINNKK
jgi:hypothetical protein